MAEGARDPRLRRARRLRRVRAARRAGPARDRAARPAAGAAVHLRGGDDRRRRGDGQPHRLHRRGRLRAAVHEPRTPAQLWDAVLERGVVPCGLGARDTLRLEVCYPLHGNDIGPDTDAISAGPRLGVRARQGVRGRRGSPPRQGGRARAAARRLRDGGEGDPAAGDADRRAAARSRPARTRRCSRSGSGWATCRPRRRSPGPS